MATFGHDIFLLQTFFCQLEHLLRIDLFFFLRLFFFLLLFIVAERESQIFLPVTGLLFFQFILIRFSQDDCFAANGGQQFFFILGIMQFAQLLNNGFFRADFKNSLRISSPIFWFALRSLRRMAAILARARAVVAKTSHCGCTRCDFEVRISTWSPLCNLWLNGTNLWLTLAPIQWLPISVCRENAKSRAVEFCGIVFSSPLGVNTNISEANKLSLMVSRKSMASGCGSSNISLMVFNHFSNSPSSSLPPPSLYFQ